MKNIGDKGHMHAPKCKLSEKNCVIIISCLTR